MKLTFNKIENKYVSEFEVTSDFNLHVERPNGGLFNIYQRTSASGKYAKINEFNTDGKSVVDVDFTGIVYPKSIKVVTNVEPVVAEVVTDGEVIPSAGGGSRNIKYYDLSGAALEVKQGMPMYALMMKYNFEASKAILGCGQLMSLSMGGALSEKAELAVAVAIDLDAVFTISANEQIKMSDLITPEAIAELGLPEITEEEFYNIN